MWRNRNPHALLVHAGGMHLVHSTMLVEMQTGAATVEDSMEVPQKIKNRTILQSNNSTTVYLSKEIKNTNSRRNMLP